MVSYLYAIICSILSQNMNHRMTFNAFPVDVQGGRNCRNRHVAETTAIHFQRGFRVGTCNCRSGALSLRRCIHFPNPSTASKTISPSVSGLQLQVLPIRSNTRSKSSFQKEHLNLFCSLTLHFSRFTDPFISDFHISLQSNPSRNGTTWNVSEPQVQLLNLNSIDLRELEEKVAGQPLTSYFPNNRGSGKSYDSPWVFVEIRKNVDSFPYFSVGILLSFFFAAGFFGEMMLSMDPQLLGSKMFKLTKPIH